MLSAIEATGAGRILLTHGYTSVLARWLRERGLDADILETRYQGEIERDEAEGEEVAEPETRPEPDPEPTA